MKRMLTFAAALALLSFAVPAMSFATALTAPQASAVIGLLRAFGADQKTIAQVERTLGTTPADPPAPAPPMIPHLSPIGSPYPSSNLGYDLSFDTVSYPADFFNFGVIGVTGGKAFVDNSRLYSEIAWARVSSNTAPTVYMNLNAPYGSTVAANIGGPKGCAPSISTSTDPTACEGYNYGYNAAAHSFAYANNNGLRPSLWWLDIEEANSWSPDTDVNDATLQGAIDYLNAQGARVGIYSVRRMWRDIAGATFTPSQMINGIAVPIPNWVPVGIATQVSALNACATGSGFIITSPVWLIQYEASSTAVDQNIAC